MSIMNPPIREVPESQSFFEIETHGIGANNNNNLLIINHYRFWFLLAGGLYNRNLNWHSPLGCYWKNGLKNNSFPALLFSAPVLPASVKVGNFIVSNCLKIWHQIKKGCRLPDTAIFAPVYRNDTLSPSLSDAAFNMWRLSGIVPWRIYILTFFLFSSHNTFLWYSQIRN